MDTPFKLHIGGQEPKDGWKILNISPGPHVDFVGSCTDLSLFADDSVDEVYASHVLEHLQLPDIRLTLAGILRILKPGALLKGSVPDLAILSRLFIELDAALHDPARDHSTEQSQELFADNIRVVNMIYGGHLDEFDVHHFGFTMIILSALLSQAGFSGVKREKTLGEFEDTSEFLFNGTPISLNFIARK